LRGGAAPGPEKEVSGGGFIACALGRGSSNGQSARQPPIVEGCLAPFRCAGCLLSGTRRIAASQRQPSGELRRIRLKRRGFRCTERVGGCGEPYQVVSIVRDQATQKGRPRSSVDILAVLDGLRCAVGFGHRASSVERGRLDQLQRREWLCTTPFEFQKCCARIGKRPVRCIGAQFCDRQVIPSVADGIEVVTRLRAGTCGAESRHRLLVPLQFVCEMGGMRLTL
jgi:hypothetical protein